MNDRLSDEELARLAAKHALHPEGKPPQPERISPLKSQGVVDEKTLAEHALKVIQADDTKCFRGAYGREVYANDRMNTIVIINDLKPQQSSVFYNDKLDESDAALRKTATERLEIFRTAEASDAQKRGQEITIEIRTGGSKALEEDRITRPAEQSAEITALKAKAVEDSSGPDDPTKPGAQKRPEPPAPLADADSKMAALEAEKARLRQQSQSTSEQQKAPETGNAPLSPLEAEKARLRQGITEPPRTPEADKAQPSAEAQRRAEALEAEKARLRQAVLEQERERQARGRDQGRS